MIYATETADIRPLQKDEYSILCTADSATENLVFLTFCHTDRPRNPEIYGSIIQITFNSLLPTSANYKKKKLTTFFFLIGIIFMIIKCIFF